MGKGERERESKSYLSGAKPKVLASFSRDFGYQGSEAFSKNFRRAGGGKQFSVGRRKPSCLHSLSGL